MNRYLIQWAFLFLPLLAWAQKPVSTVDITVKFPNLTEDKGTVFAQLFDENQKVYTGKTVEVRANFVQITFHQVPAGTYAVRAFHDIDNDGEMNANWMGIPTEPYGFSNNVRGKIGPPSFSSQLFEVKRNTIIEIVLE